MKPVKRRIYNIVTIISLLIPKLVMGIEYKLLEPSILLGNQNNYSSSDGLFKYLGFLFSTALVMATVLSVVMLVIGGIEYIASGIPGAKSDAKNRINNALFGLFIALFAWLLLNTIDPSFINLKIQGLSS